MENTIHNQPETNEPAEEKKQGGLSASKIDRYLRFVVFLVFIGLVYIWNSHWAESQIRHEEELEEAIREAKSEYKTSNARLSHDTKRSVVAAKVEDSLGLKLPDDPPFVIVKKN